MCIPAFFPFLFCCPTDFFTAYFLKLFFTETGFNININNCFFRTFYQQMLSDWIYIAFICIHGQLYRKRDSFSSIDHKANCIFLCPYLVCPVVTSFQMTTEIKCSFAFCFHMQHHHLFWKRSKHFSFIFRTINYILHCADPFIQIQGSPVIMPFPTIFKFNIQFSRRLVSSLRIRCSCQSL